MNINGGFDYINSPEGQSNLFEKIRLENNSPYGKASGGFDAESLLKYNSATNKAELNRAGITGGHADLGRDFDNLMNRIGSAKNSGRVDYITDAKKIRDKAIARNAGSSTSRLSDYARRNLGFDKDVIRATTPSFGGGTNTFYAVSGREMHMAMGAVPHLNRSAHFALGKGVIQDVANNLGIMTRHQKDVIRSSSVGTFNKVMTGIAPVFGVINMAIETSPYLTGERESTLTDNAATAAVSAAVSLSAGIYGFRVAKEATHAITSLVPKGASTGKMAMARWAIGKQGVGIAGGLVGGGLATLGIGAGFELAKSMASQDNAINNVKRKMLSGDVRGDTSVNTQQALTSRQRAFQKLSKSSLNDRASLLGNEASVLKGIL